MAYQSLLSREHEALSDSDLSPPDSPSHHPPYALLSSPMETQAENRGSDADNSGRPSAGDHLESMLQSMISAGARYEMVEDDDYEIPENDMEFPQVRSPTNSIGANDATFQPPEDPHESIQMPKPLPRPIPIRTVSREGTMRHPTPDLQSLQGAYVGNVERLERSAERLSMSSDIGEQLRKIRVEQKRSESRKSSLARTEGGAQMPTASRKFSTSSNVSNSILGINSVARSGGFSPSAYVTSPIGSLRSPSWTHHSIRDRSISHEDRLMTQVSEPEREGRPLDAPISVRSIPVIKPPKPPPHGLQVMEDEAVSPANNQNQAPSHGPPLSNPQDHHDEPVEYPDRPPTTASTDTHRQATNLFADFDGVHITPRRDFSHESQSSLQRQLPLVQPLLANNSQLYSEPPAGENIVYYPAPVPMMINLPQKLSRLPPTNQRNQRRTQMLETLNPKAKKPAAGLPNVLEVDDGEPATNTTSKAHKMDSRQSMANLPPQLRASMFFEHQSLHQDVEVKGGSAVATLDSILDASAFAPVSAFTDHPIVGHVGSEVYGKPLDAVESPGMQAADRKSRNSLNLLKKRHSSSTLLKFYRNSHYSALSLGKRRDSSAPQLTPNDMDTSTAAVEQHDSKWLGSPREDAGSGGHSDEDNEFLDAREDFDENDQEGHVDEDENVNPYNGPPTTLLAELQLRKQQQKQRNRSAATAFPQGMHSTLLQLDAVAQIEKQSRKHKHIKLAWEDPNIQHPGRENEDDEDIPLGMLYPRGHMVNRISGQLDEDRPLGLIAKRTLEDNEPLSHRRARLKGAPPPRRPGPYQQVSSHSLNAPGLHGSLGNKEGAGNDEVETLGQRSRRLKQPSEVARPISAEFASEVLSQFGGLEAPNPKEESQTPDPEETLGQRRKRLQAERQAQPRQVSGDSCNENNDSNTAHLPYKHRRSLADILQAHPIKPDRTLSQETVPQVKKRGSLGGTDGLLQQYELMTAQSRQRLDDEAKVGVLNSFTSDPSAKPRTSVFNRRTSSSNLLVAPGIPTPNSIYSPDYRAVHEGIHHNMHQSAVPATYPKGPTGVNSYRGMIPNASTMTLPMAQSNAPLDTKNRNIIDRWRQSVQY
ncbi:hypothetical protein MMC14_008194 [Varicellaria rhodocarpa]|nr:hypothetical protein [Varicellaria rhodocarpa]